MNTTEPAPCAIGRLRPDRDLDAVVAIEAAVFRRPGPRKDMLLAALDPERRGHAYVARSNQAVRAYCIGQLVVDELHIHTLAVGPAWRRAGLARRLLQTVLREAVALGVRSATLEVRRSNGAARQLYEGAGFTPGGVRPGYYTDPKDDALIYWRHESDHPVAPTGLPSG
ncbi:MAG: ribosomal protein S18-alanine N-acetyltransferase [bacterium]